MSYRIDYCEGKGKRPAVGHMLRLPLLTALFFLLFLMRVHFCWPEGMEWIYGFLQFVRSQTAAALNLLEEDFLNREPLSDVFSDFFQTFANDSH